MSRPRSNRTHFLKMAGKLLAVLLAVAAVPSAAGFLPARADQSIIMLVNDRPISKYDLDQRLGLLLGREIPTIDQVPPEAREKFKQQLGKIRDKALDMLTDEAVQLGEAKKQGISVDKSQIDAALQRIAQSNKAQPLTVDQMKSQLASIGVNIHTLRQRIEAQIAWGQVVQKKFIHTLSVSNAQIDKMVASESDDSAKTAEYELKQVSFAKPANADQKLFADQIRQAEALRHQFTTCDKLSELVKGTTGASMEDVGRRKGEDINRPARFLLAAAKTGQMTPPTLMPTGVQLYAVCAKRMIKDDDKMRHEAENKLKRQQLGLQAKRYLRDLRQDALIERR